MRIPTLSPLLVTPRGVAVSDCEKAEALVVGLETHLQPVSYPMDPTTIEMVDVALRAYSSAPASKPVIQP